MPVSQLPSAPETLAARVERAAESAGVLRIKGFAAGRRAAAAPRRPGRRPARRASLRPPLAGKRGARRPPRRHRPQGLRPRRGRGRPGGLRRMHLPVTTVSLDEGERADRPRPGAGGRRARCSFTDSDLMALAARAGPPRRRDCRRCASPRCSSCAIPCPSISTSRRRRPRRALRARALPRRPRLLALRPRAPRGGLRGKPASRLAVLPGDDRPDPRLCAFSTGSPDLLRYARRLFPGRRRRESARPPAASCPQHRPRRRRPVASRRCRAPSRGLRSAARSRATKRCRALAPDRPPFSSSSTARPCLAGDTAASRPSPARWRARRPAVLTIAVAEPEGRGRDRPPARAIARARPLRSSPTTAFSARDDGRLRPRRGRLSGPPGRQPPARRARPGVRLGAGPVAPPTSRCRSCFRNSTAASRVGPSPSRRSRAPDAALGFTGRRQSARRGRHRRAPPIRSCAWIALRGKAAAAAAARARALRLSRPRRPCRLRRRPRHAGERRAASSIASRAEQATMRRARSTDAALMPALTRGAARPSRCRSRLYAALARRRCRRPARDSSTRPGAPARPTLPCARVPSGSGRALPATSSSPCSPTAAAARDRKARYHDPDAPPSHAYLAFYLGLRDERGRRRADPSRHARHDRVAARQGRGALGRCWPASRRRARCR